MGGVVIILATLVGYFVAKLITMSAPTGSALLLLFLFVGHGAGRVPRRLHQDHQAAQPRAAQQGQDDRPDGGGPGLRRRWRCRRGSRTRTGLTPASHHISFIRDYQGFALPTVVVMVLIWLIVTATSNGVNLTDGLDGLAAGASMMVFGAYMLVNIWQNNQSCASDGLDQATEPLLQVRDPLDLAVVAAALTGACFGFLWWNASPAAIFMGDTGSLSLGGAVAGLAILTRTELLLVILRRAVRPRDGLGDAPGRDLQGHQEADRHGRRVFRIAPIHHHFEMLGWEQVTVTIRFWIITGLCVAAGLGVFYAEWVAGIG